MTVTERTYGGRPLSDRLAERRRRFLDAGLTEFTGRGYAASSVTSICQRAGLSRRQFYELFPGREDLLLALYDEIQGEARSLVVQALEATPNGDKAELARAAMTAYMTSVGADPRRAALCFVQIVGASDRAETHRMQGRERWVDYFVVTMADLVDRPRDDRQRHLATAFVGALIGLVHRWSIAEDRAPLDEIVDVLADILLAFTEL